MQPLDPSGFFADDFVLAQLLATSGTQHWSFRYDHLDFQNHVLGDLTPKVTACTINHDYLADIKRTAQFTIEDGSSFDYLKDRIKPWARLYMPGGGYVEWPQGVFLTSSPTRTDSDGTDTVIRQVDAYDQLQVFNDDIETGRFGLHTGVVITDQIVILLNSTVAGTIAMAVTPSTATLPAIREWDPGTTKLQVINDLLAMINYNSLWFDENGVAMCQPYQSPTDRPPEFTYVDDSASVIEKGVNQTLDLFAIPNSWRYTVSNPDQPMLTSSYTNTNPASITSTVNRGRTITVLVTDASAADQASLDAIVARAAHDASQVYETVDWSSGLMPIHTNNNVYTLTYSLLGISDKYSETSWSLPMDATASMSHSARKIVSV